MIVTKIQMKLSSTALQTINNERRR